MATKLGTLRTNFTCWSMTTWSNPISAAPPGRSDSPPPSWCAWPWRRSCSAPAPSTIGSEGVTAGSGTQQPGYYKRVKSGGATVNKTLPYLATQCPSWTDGLRLVDGTPIPCGTSRETAKRSQLGELRLLRIAVPLILGPEALREHNCRGTPVAWCLADPQIGEIEVAAELFDRARERGIVREDMVVLADKGLSAAGLERFCAEELNLLLVRPDRKDEKKRRYGNLAGMRQRLEAVYDTCKDQLGLECHGGRTAGGVYARVAQRLLALAATIWHNWTNWTINADAKRSLIAHDH